MSWRHFALAAVSMTAVALAIHFSGAGIGETLQTLVKGSLGSPSAIGGTIKETTPLLIAGLAVFLALRAGLFNIGVEGQLIVGAMACAVVALVVGGPLGLMLAVGAGVAAGGLWALPAGLIKAHKGGHEVITTIMLNRVAVLVTTALVAGPLRDPAQEGTTTASISEESRFPWLYSQPPVMISSAVLVAVLAMLALGWWLRRTVAGYELEATGANPGAAAVAGVATKAVTVRAMVASGAIAGFAGAAMVLAYEGRFYAGFSPGYGFTALGVALLAGASVYALLPAALLFGILEKGGTSIQLLGVPKGITYVILGILIVFAAAMRYRRPEVG